MKYLILFLSFNLLAMTNYVPENKGNTTYTDQGVCQLKSGQTCYPFDSSRDLEVMLVKDIQVDNPEKPTYAARTDETDCVLEENVEAYGLNDCRSLTAIVNQGTEEQPDYVHVLCSDKTYYSVYADKKDFGLGEGYFAYCTKLLGYEQKTVKQLLVDPALEAVKLAAKQAEEAAQLAKKQAYDAAKEAVKSAKGKIKNLSKDELNALLEQILILLGD